MICIPNAMQCYVILSYVMYVHIYIYIYPYFRNPPKSFFPETVQFHWDGAQVGSHCLGHHVHRGARLGLFCRGTERYRTGVRNVSFGKRLHSITEQTGKPPSLIGQSTISMGGKRT